MEPVPISSTTSVVAVVGDPVDHSLSPVIHNAAFAHAGLDWVMVALGVDRGRGPEIVSAVRTLGLVGLAVTAPHKQAVARSVDRLAPAAAALDSVNTVHRQDDELVGASTDGDGFVASLEEAGVDIVSATVAIIGAGGAARSVIDALARSGVGAVSVINRTPEAAQAAAALAPSATVIAPAEMANAVSGADLVVNATTIGMGSTDPDDLAIDRSWLRSGQVVADLVYHPLQTPLLRAATEAGAQTIDGLGMLVHQAAFQQRLWTGVDPDIGVMRMAAHSALRARR